MTSHRLWRPGAAVLAFSFLAFPLGSAATTVGAALMLVCAAFLTLRALNRHTPRRIIRSALLAWGVLGYWSILLLNPNVPSFHVGYLGLSKSCELLTGLIIGLLWPSETQRSQLVNYICILFSASVIVSILIHLLAPSEELSFSRRAGVYTALLFGKERLQGIFAGPFHIAMVGSFLVLAGVQRFFRRTRGRGRLFALLTFGLGVASINLSAVRTAYVAVAVGVIVLVALPATQVRKSTLRATITITVGSVAIGVLSGYLNLASIDPAAATLTTVTSSARDIGRLSTWHQASDLIFASPIYGWGPGSAGDTLGAYFPGGSQYISPHNVILKYGVEGGIVGLILILTLTLYTVRGIDRRHQQLSFAAIAIMFVFSMLGDSVEAFPVAAALLCIVGAEVSQTGYHPTLVVPRPRIQTNVTRGPETRTLESRHPLQ